jgi:hypothetical protein
MSQNANTEPAEQRWLLLIHQIPPKPDYLRVKIGRRLQRVGAVAVKNSVYVLPDGEQQLEDFQWIRAEIVEGGGDASICRADFVDGLTADDVRQLFQRARRGEYNEIALAARRLLEARRAAAPADGTPGTPDVAPADQEIARLKTRFAAVRAIDFFGGSESRPAQDALDALDARARPSRAEREFASYRNRTWVTRAGVFVDRIASAWLIRTFIDSGARFAFVPAEGYRAKGGELRFDMFEAEFTHEGDRCTFETLLRRFGLDTDPALAGIAEIVHDIDLKDAKYAREEAPGLERILSGLTRSAANDAERVDRGGAVFAALYESLRDSR